MQDISKSLFLNYFILQKYTENIYLGELSAKLWALLDAF